MENKGWLERRSVRQSALVDPPAAPASRILIDFSYVNRDRLHMFRDMGYSFFVSTSPINFRLYDS